MALDKSLKGGHAVAAIGVPVEIDHQKPINTAGDRRQCLRRPAPPIGNDVLLGGRNVLPVLDQGTFVDTGRKNPHADSGERTRGSEVCVVHDRTKHGRVAATVNGLRG